MAISSKNQLPFDYFYIHLAVFFFCIFDTLRILKTIEKEREGKIEFTLPNFVFLLKHFLYFMNDVFSFPITKLQLCVRNKGKQFPYTRYTLRATKREEKGKGGEELHVPERQTFLLD